MTERLDGAACVGKDVNMFFPWGEQAESPSNPTLAAIKAAKLICKECPVKVECLNVALELNCHYGIWGGLTYSERKKLSKK